MIKKIKKQKKGMALLWALIVTLVMIIIATSMAELIIKELRMNTNINLSEQAYAAARSGMEIGRNQNCILTTINGVLDATNGVGYDVVITADLLHPSDSNYCHVESTGYVGSDPNKVSRKLISDLSPKNYAGKIAGFPDDTQNLPSDPAFIIPFTEKIEIVKGGNGPGANFYQQFDVEYDNVPGRAYFGTALNTDLSKHFLVGINNRKIEAMINDTTVTGPDLNPAITNGQTLRFKVNYSSGNFIVSVSNSVTGDCLGKKIFTNVPNYHFDTLALSDGTNTTITANSTTPHSGIKVGSPGNFLQNMILDGMASLPPTCALSGSRNGTMVLYLNWTTNYTTDASLSGAVNYTLPSNWLPISQNSWWGWYPPPSDVTMTVNGPGGTGNCSVTIP